MTVNGFFQIGLYLVVLGGLVKPLGGYMAKVYAGEPNMLSRALGPVERLVYRLLCVNPGEEMSMVSICFSMRARISLSGNGPRSAPIFSDW